MGKGWPRIDLPKSELERLIDIYAPYNVNGALVRIHDQPECPRLSIHFDTGIYSGLFNPLWVVYEIDIYKTIQHDQTHTVTGSPAIAPVIRRWQTFIQLYHHHACDHDGVVKYKWAYSHLKKISPLALEYAKARALPKEYALQKHLDLSGNEQAVGGSNFKEELFFLQRAIFFMNEPEYKTIDSNLIGYVDIKVRLREKFNALKRYLENCAEIRAAVEIQNSRRYAELLRKKWLDDYDVDIKKEKISSLHEVLSYLEDDFNRCLNMRSSRLKIEAKKSIMLRSRTSDHDAKLEHKYLAKRIGITSKKFGEYMRDKSMAEYIKETNSVFVSDAHIRHPSALPEAPFDYPDTYFLRDEFDFPAHTVIPLRGKVDVYYRDTNGRLVSNPISLMLSTQ